jgi:lipoic acid synthetase
VRGSLRRQSPQIGLELLTPDFHRCQSKALDSIYRRLLRVQSTQREVQLVWGHNVETVPSLYRTVRKGADYQRSLALL